jgi:hypothetical protein
MRKGVTRRCRVFEEDGFEESELRKSVETCNEVGWRRIVVCINVALLPCSCGAALGKLVRFGFGSDPARTAPY